MSKDISLQRLKRRGDTATEKYMEGVSCKAAVLNRSILNRC